MSLEHMVFHHVIRKNVMRNATRKKKMFHEQMSLEQMPINTNEATAKFIKTSEVTTNASITNVII